MFIIFSLLGNGKNKLVLWLVSSALHERRKDVDAGWKWHQDACQGLLLCGAWWLQSLGYPGRSVPFSAQKGHGETLEVHAPLLTLFLALSMQLVAEDHLSSCALPTAAGVCHRNPAWGGGRGCYLQLICLLVSEVFGGQLAQKPKGCTFQKTSLFSQNTRAALSAHASSPQQPQHGSGLTLHPSPCQRSPHRGMACPNSLGLVSPEGPLEPVKGVFVTGAQ